jgi:hypothetical protein
MDPAFSRRGEAPTAFERGLLDSVHVRDPETTQDLWLLVAQRAGLDALMLVLDEFGNGPVWVPTRRTFFNALCAPAVERMIVTMIDQHVSRREIARRLNMSHTQVQRIAARHRGTSAHGTVAAKCETQRG